MCWSEGGLSIGSDELKQTATGWTLITGTAAPRKEILGHLWEGGPRAKVSIGHGLSIGRGVQCHTALKYKSRTIEQLHVVMENIVTVVFLRR